MGAPGDLDRLRHVTETMDMPAKTSRTTAPLRTSR
jgi:hypothetical protein